MPAPANELARSKSPNQLTVFVAASVTGLHR
jgi:hypothetical protein